MREIQKLAIQGNQITRITDNLMNHYKIPTKTHYTEPLCHKNKMIVSGRDFQGAKITKKKKKCGHEPCLSQT